MPRLLEEDVNKGLVNHSNMRRSDSELTQSGENENGSGRLRVYTFDKAMEKAGGLGKIILTDVNR